MSHFGCSKSHAPKCDSLPIAARIPLRLDSPSARPSEVTSQLTHNMARKRGPAWTKSAQGFFKARWSWCYQVGSHWFHQIRNRLTMIHRLKLQMVQRQSRGMRQNRQNVAAVVMLRPMVLPKRAFAMEIYEIWASGQAHGTNPQDTSDTKHLQEGTHGEDWTAKKEHIIRTA